MDHYFEEAAIHVDLTGQEDIPSVSATSPRGGYPDTEPHPRAEVAERKRTIDLFTLIYGKANLSQITIACGKAATPQDISDARTYPIEAGSRFCPATANNALYRFAKLTVGCLDYKSHVINLDTDVARLSVAPVGETAAAAAARTNLRNRYIQSTRDHKSRFVRECEAFIGKIQRRNVIQSSLGCRTAYRYLSLTGRLMLLETPQTGSTIKRC